MTTETQTKRNPRDFGRMVLTNDDGTARNPGADHEGYTRVGQRATGYIQHEIYCNVGGLIDVLLEAKGPEYLSDNGKNYYQPNPDKLDTAQRVTTLHEIRECADDVEYSLWDVTLDEVQVREVHRAITAAIDANADLDAGEKFDEIAKIEGYDFEDLAVYADDNDYGSIAVANADALRTIREALEEAVRENCADEAVEVYEWWAVSSWLGGKLADAGEFVLDAEGLEVWGRCCTGQAIKLDGILQQIAAEYISDGEHAFDPATGYHLKVVVERVAGDDSDWVTVDQPDGVVKTASVGDVITPSGPRRFATWAEAKAVLDTFPVGSAHIVVDRDAY